MTPEQRESLKRALLVDRQDGVQVRLERCSTWLEVEGVLEHLRACQVPITTETLRAAEQRKKEVRDDRDPRTRR